jgi:membrane associated rhomboid family serine protease
VQANPLVAAGQWWRLLTPAFLHANLAHLAVNSYSLNNLGPPVEAATG